MFQCTNAEIRNTVRTAICDPVKEMTENNHHTQAVVYLAKKLTDIKSEHRCPFWCDTLYRWASFIQSEHERIGHIPEELNKFRSDILNKILEAYDAIFHDPEINKMIHDSL